MSEKGFFVTFVLFTGIFCDEVEGVHEGERIGVSRSVKIHGF